MKKQRAQMVSTPTTGYGPPVLGVAIVIGLAEIAVGLLIWSVV